MRWALGVGDFTGRIDRVQRLLLEQIDRVELSVLLEIVVE
jgi:hypothetical protein